jgi:hypothetical protein
MNTNVDSKPVSQAVDAAVGRSEIIAMAVGLTIILGGLWLLYSSTGPYHPDVPLSENIVQGVTGS